MVSCQKPVISYCSWGEGRLDIVKYEQNGIARHKSIENGVHSEWKNIPPMPPPRQMASAPAICSWGSGRLDLAAQGDDAALWHCYFSGGQWSSWESLGGEILGPPAICTWATGRLDCFGLGTDNACWQKTFSSSTWQTWNSLGGEWAGGPTATCQATGYIDVICIDSNGYIYQISYNGTWSAWKELTNRIYSQPSLVSLGPGRLDLFGVGEYGALWHKWYDNGAWTSMKYFGGKNANSPSVVAIGKKILYLCYLDKEGHACLRTWNGKSWSNWKFPEQASIEGHKTERIPRKVIPKQDLLPWIVTQKSVVFGLNDFKNMLVSGKAFQAEVLSKANDFIVYFTRLVISNGQKSIRNWFKNFFLKKVEGFVKPVVMAKVQKMLGDTQNHIKNSTGARGLEEWTVLENGGDGWVVREEMHALPCARKKKQMAFGGSNQTCKMIQSVAAADMPILKESNFKCEIQAGAYINARNDCPSQAKIILQAINDNEEIFNEQKVEYDNLQFALTNPLTFKFSVLKINDPQIISKAVKFNLILETKDLKFWAGNFGSNFTDMFVRAVPTSYLI